MEDHNDLLNNSLEHRKVFERYLKEIALSDLFKIPKGYSNNIIWQIGHTISVQQLLIYGLSDLPLKVTPEFAKKYGRGSFPSGEIKEQDLIEIKSLLFTTVEEIRKDLDNNVFKAFKPYKTLPGIVLNNVYDALNFNNFHDMIHLKRMEALKEALFS